MLDISPQFGLRKPRSLMAPAHRQARVSMYVEILFIIFQFQIYFESSVSFEYVS